MKITIADNRTNVTFTLQSIGNSLTEKSNQIHAICKRFNAQENLFNNRSSFKTDKHGNAISPQLGSIGGTVTFHSHSCDHITAANELVLLLESFGVPVSEILKEVIRTHRKDGTPYKCAQTFIEAV